jgi:predicted DNA-binding transcriptional regulator AlpA
MSLEHSPSRQFRTANQVRARYGGISDMTLWRWLNDPALNFPKPVVINNRRYFSDEQLDQFDRAQAAKSQEATNEAA